MSDLTWMRTALAGIEKRMSESKQATWRAYTSQCGRSYVDSGDQRECIAMVEQTGARGVEIAHLIAAAPDLLEAAEALLAKTPSWTISDGGADWPDRVDALVDAIARAKGEQS